MNQLIKMNPETYAKHWSNEATRFDEQNLYVELARFSPKERILELGCGNGLGTKQLASDREVLVIDNNRFLLQKAKENNSSNPNITFMEADIFALSPEHIKRIRDFSPHGIVAWLMGSDPDTVESRTPTNTALSERPKLYREAVEDLLVLEPLCTPSVKWIHLANRGGIDSNSEHHKNSAKRSSTFLFRTYARLSRARVSNTSLSWVEIWVRPPRILYGLTH